MLRFIILGVLLLFSVNCFLEENEGLNPSERTCTPEEERSAQSCRNGLTVLSATFDSIQGQHESFTANDHIRIDQNCKTAVTCLKKNVGCSGISQEDVDQLKQKCDYMVYLTGAFYPCSQNLMSRKADSECVRNFFDITDDSEMSKEEKCAEWSKNRACLKWTVRDACRRSYWKQYKPYWHLRYSLLKCI